MRPFLFAYIRPYFRGRFLVLYFRVHLRPVFKLSRPFVGVYIRGRFSFVYTALFAAVRPLVLWSFGPLVLCRPFAAVLFSPNFRPSFRVHLRPLE